MIAFDTVLFVKSQKVRKKVFNWSEVHLYRSTSYKIHILERPGNQFSWPTKNRIFFEYHNFNKNAFQPVSNHANKPDETSKL